jgi:hypothetical protein
MTQPQPDRRANRRFFLDLPIVVKFVDSQVHEMKGQTRDISSRGVFFYVGSQFEEGAAIEFVLTLPSEITSTDPIRVRCFGKIVRLDQAGGKLGVAVAIEKYDFVRQT